MGILIPPDRILDGSAELQCFNSIPKSTNIWNWKLFSNSTGGRTQTDLTLVSSKAWPKLAWDHSEPLIYPIYVTLYIGLAAEILTYLIWELLQTLEVLYNTQYAHHVTILKPTSPKGFRWQVVELSLLLLQPLNTGVSAEPPELFKLKMLTATQSTCLSTSRSLLGSLDLPWAPEAWSQLPGMQVGMKQERRP